MGRAHRFFGELKWSFSRDSAKRKMYLVPSFQKCEGLEPPISPSPMFTGNMVLKASSGSEKPFLSEKAGNAFSMREKKVEEKVGCSNLTAYHVATAVH